jgi:hypothetical protein
MTHKIVDDYFDKDYFNELQNVFLQDSSGTL